MTPLLRIWFIGSAALLGLVAMYEYAPILLPLLAVAVILGVATWAITALARRLQRTRDADPSGDPTDQEAGKSQ